MRGQSETKNILLVEDNPKEVRLTKELLGEEGIESPTHIINDGEEALDFLHQRGDHADAPRPDVILLDWHLKKMTGGEILAEVKNDASLKDIPVVVLSGSGAGLERLREESPQADRYISKPIDPDEYIDITNEL